MTRNVPLDERVMRRLKLRELRILMAVAQAGSMGKAATQLGLSQPAVSKAIAEMEQAKPSRLHGRYAASRSSIARRRGSSRRFMAVPCLSGLRQSSMICARGCARWSFWPILEQERSESEVTR